MTRKRLATTGERGALVRLYEETRADVRRYVVEWGPRRGRAERITAEEPKNV
jgi:hypothetical protein